MARAPAVTYPALALQLLAAHSMAAVPTGINLETAILVHERISERIADLIGCSYPSERRAKLFIGVPLIGLLRTIKFYSKHFSSTLTGNSQIQSNKHSNVYFKFNFEDSLFQH